MKYCMNCGTEIPEGMKFCGNCGTALVLPSNSGESEAVKAPKTDKTGSETEPQNKIPKKNEFLEGMGIIFLTLLGVAATLGLIILICDSANSHSKESSEVTDEIVEEIMEETYGNTDPVPVEEVSEIPEEPVKKDHYDLKLAGVTYIVPGFYETDNSSVRFFSNDSKLRFALAHQDIETEQDFINIKDIVENLMDSNMDNYFAKMEAGDMETISVAERTAFKKEYSGLHDNEYYSVKYTMLFNENTQSTTSVVLYYETDSPTDYDEIYNNILSTAYITALGPSEIETNENEENNVSGEATETSGNAEEINEAEENTSDAPVELNDTTDIQTTGGVDPELKAFLDEYEAFMDEYIAFMNKYISNPGNALTMLNDYSSMVSRLEQFEKAADRYNPNSMSAADSAYYLEVMTRIEQKLLNVAF